MTKQYQDELIIREVRERVMAFNWHKDVNGQTCCDYRNDGWDVRFERGVVLHFAERPPWEKGQTIVITAAAKEEELA